MSKKKKPFLAKVVPALFHEPRDPMLERLRAGVANQQNVLAAPQADVGGFPFVFQQVFFKDILPPGALAWSDTTNRGKVVLSNHAFGIYYRRRGSSPNGRFMLKAGGHVIQTFLPGDFIRVESSTWELTRQTIGFESSTINVDSQSYFGEANFVLVMRPDANYRESENDTNAFLPVSLLGDMYKLFSTGRGVPSMSSYSKVTDSLTDCHTVPGAGSACFYAGGFKRLRIWILDSTVPGACDFYLIASTFNISEPSFLNITGGYRNAHTKVALDTSSWGNGVSATQDWFDYDFGERCAQNVYLAPYIITPGAVGATVRLAIQGVA